MFPELKELELNDNKLEVTTVAFQEGTYSVFDECRRSQKIRNNKKDNDLKFFQTATTRTLFIFGRFLTLSKLYFGSLTKVKNKNNNNKNNIAIRLFRTT